LRTLWVLGAFVLAPSFGHSGFRGSLDAAGTVNEAVAAVGQYLVERPIPAS